MITYVVVIIGYLLNLISFGCLADDEETSSKLYIRIGIVLSLIVPYITFFLLLSCIGYYYVSEIIKWAKTGELRK